MTKLTEKDIRDHAESDLLTFIRLVAKNRVLGDIHKDLCAWWNRTGAADHQLVLLPREHMKSTLMAYRVCWEITRSPSITVLYISATANLAEKQLGLIKTILTSPEYTRYWPEMINRDEGKREKWTNSEIAIDHPSRKSEQVRDPTVFTAGLTTNITGLHCDIAVLDDVVVAENAYTAEGRAKVEAQYSLLSSIETAGSKEWVVGTRYHPNDLYSKLIGMTEDVFDTAGELVDSRPVYELFQREVEDRGDGTGVFLWPRAQRLKDGKWFGFNTETLARKKAKYLDKTQFYAQYYNDPNMGGDTGVRVEKFQYYDQKLVTRSEGKWKVRGRIVNVFASIDFAYSLNKRADYTAIVVIGVDDEGAIYVLDIDRFKSSKISEYFEHIRDMHVKWDFRKIRCEMTAAQSAIVRELKDQYIRPFGLALSVDEFYPTRHQGTKDERINAILQPRYENQTIWHYQGGYCAALEEELMQAHPSHDDIKDALASAVDISVPPRGHRNTQERGKVIYNTRFGGVAY